MNLTQEEIISICKMGEIQKELRGIDFCKNKKMEMNLLKKQVKLIIILHIKIIQSME